jgi:hypothetical protein
MSDHFIVRWFLPALGWLSAAFALALFGYSVYSIATGSIVFDARWSKNTYDLDTSPRGFFFALSFYLFAGTMAAWIAKQLLVNEPRWKRSRDLQNSRSQNE